MTAALLLAALAAVPSPLDAPPAVQLRPFRCDQMSDAEVRPPLAVEIRGRLLEPGPLPNDLIVVSVDCRADEVIVAAARPGQIGPPPRHVGLQGIEHGARARTVALAIAELIRISTADRPAPAATEPAPPSPPSPESLPSTELGLGPALGVYASAPDHPVLGAHARWSVLLVRPNGPTWSTWRFGPALDLSFIGASFWAGDGTLDLASVALSAIAQRRTRRFAEELELGYRFGRAKFRNVVGPDPSATHFFSGAFVTGALEWSFARQCGLKIAVEIGTTLVAPGSFCNGTTCVRFEGPWALATLGSVVRF